MEEEVQKHDEQKPFSFTVTLKGKTPAEVEEAIKEAESKIQFRDGAEVFDSATFWSFKGPGEKTNEERVNEHLKNNSTVGGVPVEEQQPKAKIKNPFYMKGGEVVIVETSKEVEAPVLDAVNVTVTLYAPQINQPSPEIKVESNEVNAKEPEKTSEITGVNDKKEEYKKDANYVPVTEYKDYKSILGVTNTDRNPSSSALFEVWIYVRALDSIVDVSRLVTNLSVNHTPQSSTFSFDLVNINDIGKDDYDAPVFNTSFNGGMITYLSKILQNNDIVFIKLEQLKVERRDASEGIGKWLVDEKYLAGRYYDLIGLIDTAEDVANAKNNERATKVQGRDLSKLLTDDQAVFFPLALVKNTAGNVVVATKTESEVGLRRNFATGNFDTLFAKNFQPINALINFFFDLIASMGVVKEEWSDLLFSSYKDQRMKTADGTKFRKGIYQIVDLIFDRTVEDKRLVDASATNPQGTMLSLMNKVCQTPFVELLLRTEKDMFRAIVRRPPFYRDALLAVKKELESQNSAVMTIASNCIVSASLKFEDNFYTWFNLMPKGLFAGNDQNVALSYCPIFQIDEYMNAWGSKPLQVTDNYADYNGLGIKKEELEKKGVSYYKQVVVNDAVFTIECNAYLPFTRKGKITLAKTDSRIKVGDWVYYEPTKEVYYVDAVQHDISYTNDSVNTSTAVTVSRGMVLNIVDKYFDIVNLEAVKELMLGSMTNKSSAKSSVTDKGTMEFFWNREQFEDWGEINSANFF
jgi:hypothetical protein